MHYRYMKATIVGIILLVLVGLGGAGWYMTTQQKQVSQVEQGPTIVTMVGKLTKAVPPGDDYTHLLLATGRSIKLNSYAVELASYEGKTVTVVGEYSGNTLFVDSIE